MWRVRYDVTVHLSWKETEPNFIDIRCAANWNVRFGILPIRGPDNIIVENNKQLFFKSRPTRNVMYKDSNFVDSFQIVFTYITYYTHGWIKKSTEIYDLASYSGIIEIGLLIIDIVLDILSYKVPQFEIVNII